MKKLLLLLALVISFVKITYSNEQNKYEDYYKKVYIVEYSKESLYNEIRANDKQKEELNIIFDKYYKKASEIEQKFKSFEEKKEELFKIENEKNDKIKEILTEEQYKTYEKIIENEKNIFNNKNGQIYLLMQRLNLTNNQKSKILKLDRDFKREIKKLDSQKMKTDIFYIEIIKLQNERNKKIEEILTEEQLKLIEEIQK